MRLMYLRVKGDCSLFKDIEICFNPEWRFTIDHDVINCQRYEEFSVPQNFYSTGSDTPVEAVNVIVGKNGSGKTTIARALKEIFSGDKTDFEYTLICRGTHPLSSGSKEKDQAEDVRKEMWLIYSFDKSKKRGVNYKCADIELVDKVVEFDHFRIGDVRRIHEVDFWREATIAIISQPSELHRVTSRHYATDLMTRAFRSNFYRLVSGGAEEAGMMGG